MDNILKFFKNLFLLLLLLFISSCNNDSKNTTNEDVTLSAPNNTLGGINCDETNLYGESVRIQGALIGNDAEAFNKALQPFIACTGVLVTYKGGQDFESEINKAFDGSLVSGEIVDIALWPQPGAVVSNANDGYLVPLEDLNIDITTVKDNFSEYLVNLGQASDEKYYGGPNAVNLKSLVWYQPEEFEKRGYSVPTTWDELIALSDQIVSDGLTPFCLSIFSGGATGWLVTDWIEDILLRINTGVENYDKWIKNEIPFTHEDIKRSVSLLSQIVHTEGYVYGGIDRILSTYFGNASHPMFERDSAGNPKCFMERQASFIPAFWPESEQAGLGTTTKAFAFPSIDNNVPKAALGAGDMWGVIKASQSTDTHNEAVALTAKFLLSKDFFEPIATNQNSLGSMRISAHTGFDTSLYQNTMTTIQANILKEALVGNSFRFDASDLMPPMVNFTFWQESTKFIENGPSYIDTMLSNIEAARQSSSSHSDE